MSTSPIALDVRLYVVTDPVQCLARGLLSTVEAALRGGATLVQLRDKTAPTRSMIAQARELCALCHRFNVPLLVNDRVDVALACGADGVHLGQDDMSLVDARRLLGPEAIIGVSIRSVEEALVAASQGASYIAANGVWLTDTKTDFGAPLGLDSLGPLSRATPLPLVAIGGIHSGNAPLLARAGCAGIAVVSAVMKAPDPALACQELRAAFDKGLSPAG